MRPRVPGPDNQDGGLLLKISQRGGDGTCNKGSEPPLHGSGSRSPRDRAPCNGGSEPLLHVILD